MFFSFPRWLNMDVVSTDDLQQDIKGRKTFLFKLANTIASDYYSILFSEYHIIYYCVDTILLIGFLLHSTHKILYKDAVTSPVLLLKRGIKSNSSSLPMMEALSKLVVTWRNMRMVLLSIFGLVLISNLMKLNVPGRKILI